MPTIPSQKPIYESISMLHPDGTVMCVTNLKRATWYIKRGIAHWTDEHKTHFKLTFVPKGKGKSDIPFYTDIIDNICVVCGETNNLNKHHVVPYVFRKRFPTKFKDNNHHDILAVCVSCHEKYEKEANKLKSSLIKLYAHNINKKTYDPNITHNKQIKSAKHILTHGKDKLPKKRIKELQTIANLPILVIEKPVHIHWADEITKKITETDDSTQEFIVMWRQHFLDIMQPKFIPANWDLHLAEYNN